MTLRLVVMQRWNTVRWALWSRSLISSSAETGKILRSVERVRGARPLPDSTDDGLLQRHNSWDVGGWSSADRANVLATVQIHRSNCMEADRAELLLQSKHQKWDRFYSKHKNKFFNDRRWLCHELSPLIEQAKMTGGDRLACPVEVLEVGCGVGNSIYPLLEDRGDIHCTAFDYSSTAIQLLKSDPRFDSGRVSAFVHDATSAPGGPPLPAGSVDIALLLFALSAVDSAQHRQVLANLMPALKPGGVILFRDYGLYDQSQVQFSSSHCIKDSLYARQDGTLVHFFGEDEMADLCRSVPGLLIDEIKMINLLLVNRKKKKKMMRCWIQGKFRKSTSP